jgi:hypothetical protein
MNVSKWKAIALTVGTAVLAVAVISPAFGGPSLRGLVKQEVAKQLDAQAVSAAKKGKRGPRGPQGAQGQQGAQGPQGLQGQQGLPGSSNVTLVRTTLTVPDGGNTDSDFADCPPGQRATGGGVGWDGGGSNPDDQRVQDSAPATLAHDLSDPPTTTGSVATAWYGNLASDADGGTGYVWVLCVPNP